MENKYNISLIVEDCTSSHIFNAEIESLKTYLAHNSINSTVETYSFNDSQELLNLENLINSSKENNKNNLVLLVTDLTSKIWKENSRMYELLDRLQSYSLVSVINPLTEKLWERLQIETSSTSIELPAKIQNNREITTELPFLISEDEYDNCLILPMVSIQNIEKLLSTIEMGGKVSNVFFHKPTKDLIEQLQKMKYYNESTENQRVKLFRSSSSKEAFSLLLLVSNIDSFTLEDINFIRNEKFPNTNKDILCELMLSGLVEKLEVFHGQQKYAMKKETKELLEGNLPSSEVYNLNLLLAEQRAEQNNQISPHIKRKI